MPVKIIVFRPKVQVVAISGCDAFLLPHGFMRKVDHQLGRYCRVLLLGRVCKKIEDGDDGEAARRVDP